MGSNQKQVHRLESASRQRTRADVIDLNADIGEGFPHDAALLALVSSANVCAGAYAGSPTLTAATIAAAAAQNVNLGAHIGYPDRANFGRSPFSMKPGELKKSLGAQLAICVEAAKAVSASVTYVKPHGALYHAIISDESTAQLVIDIVSTHRLALLHQPIQSIRRRAETLGVAFVTEGFADRRYLPSGRLVPRGEVGAVLTNQRSVVAQAIALARGDGLPAVQSICLHGDDEGALRNARAIRRAFGEAGISVAKPELK